MVKRDKIKGWAAALAAIGLARSFHRFGAEPSLLAALFLVLALITLAGAFGDPVAFAVGFLALAAYIVYQLARVWERKDRERKAQAEFDRRQSEGKIMKRERRSRLPPPQASLDLRLPGEENASESAQSTPIIIGKRGEEP